MNEKIAISTPFLDNNLNFVSILWVLSLKVNLLIEENKKILLVFIDKTESRFFFLW